MNKLVLVAVAAGLLLPTTAQAQRGPDERREAQEELRQDEREARREARREVRDAREDRRDDRREAQRDFRRDVRDDPRDARRDLRRDMRDADREYRREVRDAQRDYREDVRDARRDYRREVRQDARRDYRREVRRAQYRDWREYRRAEARAFRRGAYVAPRGHFYRPVRAGHFLRANVFWGQRYWIDPYDYYLPVPRFRHQQYIRYGNDVLLIDTRTGRVLVVYDRFFW